MRGITIREAQDLDIQEIVELFRESGENPHGWNDEKWRHYYRNYPDGKPIALIATAEGLIVGHYGLLPVKIGSTPAMLGLHAYVASSQRGLNVISLLMQEVDRQCKLSGARMICGFPNPKFSIVKSTLFKWENVCWLGFQKGVSRLDYGLHRIMKFYFEYSEKWFVWRFGSKRTNYVSLYVDDEKNTHTQLLKYSDNEFQIEDENLEVWSPRSTWSDKKSDRFGQPFSIKVYDKDLLKEGIMDCQNWSIHMGDSDTFQYNPVEKF